MREREKERKKENVMGSTMWGGNIYHRIDILLRLCTPHVGLNNDIRVSQTPAVADCIRLL